MLSWDLTNTRLMDADAPVRVPSEPELIAVVVALLAVSGVGFGELRRGSIGLTEDNHAEVAAYIASHLPMLASEFGEGMEVRERLCWLVGMTVTDA